WADVILNQNLGARKTLYPHRAAKTLLLGSRYALLRREFLKKRSYKKKILERGHCILVTLGGSDPHHVTGKVLQALELVSVSGLEVIVLVGGVNPHFSDLKTIVKTSSFKIQLIRNTHQMPQYMAWADLAISAGGTTCWEIACMGLPNIILVL